MRRIFAFLLVGGLVFAACGKDDATSGDERPRFVTTIPPFEMILTPVVEGRGTVERLLEPGSSPHTYDPTPSDLRAVETSVALVYGAEHLDGWAADLPAARRLALVDLVPEEARLEFEDHGHEGRGTGTVDPHFWTDPQAVSGLLPALADTLCAIDADGCATYRANADSFATSLAALDRRLQTMMAPVHETPVLLAQPFFRYYLHRYGPQLVGIVEPRPGTEPTARDIRALVDRGRESGVEAILTQRQLSARASEAVAESADLPLVELDPLGGLEERDTYSGLMLANARILRDALTRAP